MKFNRQHKEPQCGFDPPPSERGAALLTILLLVSVISVISVTSLDRLTLSTKIAANSNALLQARSYAFAAETLALSQIDALLAANESQTTLQGEWNGTERPLPLPVGIASVRASDGGNCFNINSLVKLADDENPGASQNDESQILEQNPVAVNQFINLMLLLGMTPSDAANIAAASADWIDSDNIASQFGAEDIFYQQLDTPYRTANVLFSDISEIRAVKDISAAQYNIIRPWICALPEPILSPINVNTLLPEQALLLTMLMPDNWSIASAREFLAKRPSSGYGSRNNFWQRAALNNITPSPDVSQQIQVTTRWFNIEINVALGDIILQEKAIVDAGRNDQKSRILSRSWGYTG